MVPGPASEDNDNVQPDSVPDGPVADAQAEDVSEQETTQKKGTTHELCHSLSLPVSVERTWAFLWDIEAVARCIPGCEEVIVVEDRKAYIARVRKKVGPFAVGIEMQINVLECCSPDFLSIEILGNDRRLRSKVRQVITLTLEGDGDSMTLDIQGQFTLTGLLSHINKHLVAGQVSQVLEDFSEAVKSELLARAATA